MAVSDVLACELCGFDFTVAYGDRGEGYIECHHIVPLHASGPTKTRPEDLILICANCHRIIHRRNPFLTPDAAMDLVSKTYDARPDSWDDTVPPRLQWSRVEPPPGYDNAYETRYTPPHMVLRHPQYLGRTQLATGTPRNRWQLRVWRHLP